MASTCSFSESVHGVHSVLLVRVYMGWPPLGSVSHFDQQTEFRLHVHLTSCAWLAPGQFASYLRKQLLQCM